MRRLITILILILIPTIAYTATTSTNGYFYLPDVGDSGSSVHSSWIAVQEATDAVIQANVNARSTSSGLSSALSDETGTGLAVFGTTPTFTTHIDIGGTTGIRASGATGVGTLGGIGNNFNEGLTIDFEEADLIKVSSATGASGVRVLGIGFRPSAETTDPCGTYETGAIFYNATSNYHCFCDGAGDDIKMNDNTTACFP